MSEELGLLLEAERRGILPPDRAALLNEARRRGLVGGAAPAQPSPGQMDQGLANEAAAQANTYGPAIRTEFPPPPRGATVSPYAREREDLRARGVDPSGAPGMAQARAGFGRSDEEAYRMQGFQTRVDAPTGRLLIRKDPNGPWTTADVPGSPNIAGWAGPAMREVPAFVGGVGGALVGARGGPIAAVGAGAAGAGFFAGGGEAARLSAGKAMGVVPEDVDVRSAARSEALFAAAFSALSGLGYNAVKALARRGLFPGLKDISPEQYEQWSKAAREKVSGTGVEDKLRPSQVLGATPDEQAQNLADRAMAHEKRILTQPGAATDRLRESMREQEGIVRQGAAGIRGEAPELTPTQLGEAAETAATRQVGQEIAGAKRRIGSVGEARQGVAEAQGALRSQTTPDDIGPSVRSAMEQAQDAADAEIRALYRPVDEATPGLRAVPKNLADTLESTQGRLSQRLLRGNQSTVENESLVSETLKNLYDEAGKLKPSSYAEIDQAIKDLRRLQRLGYRGQWTGDLKMLDDLESALLRDRETLFAGRPELLAQLRTAEGRVKEVKDVFERTRVADVLRVRRGGADAIPDEDIGNRILNSSSMTADVAKVLKSDPQFANQLEMVKDALRFKAREAAGLTRGEPVNPGALQAWVEKNKTKLATVFDEGEIRQLANPARAQREFDARSKAMETVVQKLGSRFKEFGVAKEGLGARYANPSAFFEDVMRPGNPEMARRAKDLLASQDRAAARSFEGYARSSLYDDIAPGGMPDRKKIADLLSDPNRMATYEAVIGPQFRQRLVQMDNLVKTLFPDTLPAPVEGTSSSLLRNLQRVLLSPLSALSRRVTLFRGLSEDEIANRIAMAMVDDKAFRQLARAAADSRWTRAIAMGAGGSAGASGGDKVNQKVQEFTNGR